ncbi:MAG: hypothetical protein ACLR6B_14435 [Blautia sp.]
MKIFSVFGGLSFYVFLAPYVSGQEKGLARKGLWRAAAALAALFLLVAAAFGEQGMALLPWPAVSVYEQRQGSRRLSGALGCDLCRASGDDASGECGKLRFFILGLIGESCCFHKLGKSFFGAVWLCWCFLLLSGAGKTERRRRFMSDLEQLCGGSGERGVSGDPR